MIRASAGSGKTYRLTNRYLRSAAPGHTARRDPGDHVHAQGRRRNLDRVLGRLAEAAGTPRQLRRLPNQLELPKGAAAGLRRAPSSDDSQSARVRIGTLDSFLTFPGRSFSLESACPPAGRSAKSVDDGAPPAEYPRNLLAAEETDLLIALFQRMTHGQTTRGVHDELSRIVEGLYEIQQGTSAAAWSKITVPPGLAHAELNTQLKHIEAFDLAKNTRMQKARNEDLERARAEDWRGC